MNLFALQLLLDTYIHTHTLTWSLSCWMLLFFWFATNNKNSRRQRFPLMSSVEICWNFKFFLKDLKIAEKTFRRFVQTTMDFNTFFKAKIKCKLLRERRKDPFNFFILYILGLHTIEHTSLSLLPSCSCFTPF